MLRRSLIKAATLAAFAGALGYTATKFAIQVTKQYDTVMWVYVR